MFKDIIARGMKQKKIVEIPFKQQRPLENQYRLF